MLFFPPGGYTLTGIDKPGSDQVYRLFQNAGTVRISRFGLSSIYEQLKTNMMKQFNRAFTVLQFALGFLACMPAKATCAQDSEKEKAVKAYYAGFENKDWATTSAQMADGFTFTSPAGDDHISIAAFKQKCWPTAEFTKKVSFLTMAENSSELFLLVQINTTDNKIVRNVDIFTFNSVGKIKSHECFFGTGIGYPGHHTN